MFGYVMANVPELSKMQQARYLSVYCGICRGMRENGANAARLALSYDMAFLALLLMSLYEPEEAAGKGACKLHPIKPRQWVDCEYVRYAADMNVALAYYNALDDYEDEKHLSAKLMANAFGKALPRIRETYPRQCAAIEDCLAQLRELESANCANPDLPAGCFGQLMAELLCYRQDHWSETLRKTGYYLGRYIYLADAAVDFRHDRKKKQYNPFLAMGMEEDWKTWETYLTQDLGRCTQYYESLPLVQDKEILDNILYSGVWVEYRRRQGRKANV